MSTAPALMIMCLCTFALSAAMSMAIRTVAGRFGWLAQPKQGRWHSTPTALFGGTAFFPAFLAGLGLFCFLAERPLNGFTLTGPDSALPLISTLGGGALMFLTGLFDDIRPLEPWTKLLLQFAAASIFLFGNQAVPLTPYTTVNVLVTYFWFIGITNSLNMLDNMDGLTIGTAILAGGLAAVLAAFAAPHSSAVPLGLALASACLGFWLYNKNPASIFMGDCGSLFLGFTLAALTIPGPLNQGFGLSSIPLHRAMVLLIPTGLLAVPVFDTTLVTITRLMRGQNPMVGGRDHSSHRLVFLGLSESRAVAALHIIGLAGGLLVIGLARMPGVALPFVFIFWLGLAFFGFHLSRLALPDISYRLSPGRKKYPLPQRLMAGMTLDAIVICVCLHLAYLIRFDGVLNKLFWPGLLHSIPFFVVSCLLVSSLLGVYTKPQGRLRLNEIRRFMLTSLAGTALAMSLLALFTRLEGPYSRGAYIIFGLLFFMGQLTWRLALTIIDTTLGRMASLKPRTIRPRILIYGINDRARLAMDEAVNNIHLNNYDVLGFIDDTAGPEAHLMNHPVRSAAEWKNILDDLPAQVWIAARSIDPALLEKIRSEFHDPEIKHIALKLKDITE